MSKSHRSSHASERCRLEWRPSRLCAAALIALGALSAFSLLVSEMPRAAAWPVALAALLYALRRAASERGRAVVTVIWDGRANVVRVDGAVVEGAALRWRGPLAFLAYRAPDGQIRRLLWWPDTLDARGRRELRLAAGPASASPRGGAMAP